MGQIIQDFTMAYFFMAYAYNHLALFGNTAERMKEAKKWAKKAYSLQPV
jgi:hypothetical protein